MERFFEQSVTGSSSARKRLLYILCWVFSIAFLLLAIVFAAGILGADSGGAHINWMMAVPAAVCIALAVTLYRRKDWLCLEYDYILTENQLEICAILNRRRRRRMDTILLESVESFGNIRDVKPGSLRFRKWYINENAPLYCIVYTSAHERCAVMLELNETMAELIRTSKQLRPGAWQKPEGKY